jgi:nucleolar protein 14
MGKTRSNHSKRSLGSLPKGLVRKQGAVKDPGNPFELTSRQKRPKHLVHNRPVSKPKSTEHALESLQRRQTELRSSLKSSKKSNVFVDRRIGQYDPTMSREDQMLARLVKERTRRSQRSRKYQLEDDNNDNDELVLTHKGKRLDPNQSETIYSDDEDGHGNLEAVDTELHFGGSGLAKPVDPYGGSSGAGLAQVYSHRKTELDDLIARRKVKKAERMHVKEAQAETIDKLDESFAELSELLQFRKNQAPPAVKPKPTKEEEEMNEWHRELKQMMMKPKRKATDRTKTPEEAAKEEAERLHEMETRRLARMNGDFEEDDFSDISVDKGYNNKKKKKSKKKKISEHRNPDELSDSEDEADEEHKLVVRFTADGLKHIDKNGNVVENPEEEDDQNESDAVEDDDSDPEEDDRVVHPLTEGTRVRGNYRVTEQFGGQESWYDGKITKVHEQTDGSIKYDVEYDDGDFEEDLIPENVRPIQKTAEEMEQENEMGAQELDMKFKRNKARDKARYV